MEAALSARATACLRRAGIETFEELTILREWELFRAGLWLGDVRKLVAALARSGLSLREPTLGGRVRGPGGESPTELAPAAGEQQTRKQLAEERRRERDAAILAARAEGATLQEAGVRFGLSRERVRQIIASADPSGTRHAQSVRAQRAAQHCRRADVIDAWRQGSAPRALAIEVGLPQKAISELIKRHATPADRAARRLALARAPRRPSPRRYSDEQLVGAVRRAVESAGCVPTGSKYVEIAKAEGLPSLATISNRFGNWNAALRAAGYPPNPVNQRPYRRHWTEERCLQALERLVAEAGRLPPQQKYRQLSGTRPDLPSYSTLRTRLGTWSTIAARIEPRIWRFPRRPSVS